MLPKSRVVVVVGVFRLCLIQVTKKVSQGDRGRRKKVDEKSSRNRVGLCRKPTGSRETTLVQGKTNQKEAWLAQIP